MHSFTDTLRADDPQLDALLSAATELRPLIAGRAAEGEADRNVPAAVIQAISDAGLLRIMVPKRYGGTEADIRTHLAVSAEIAKADGATAWVTALTNVCAWIVGLHPEQAQAEVWGSSPDVRTAGVLAPSSTVRRVDGGMVVNGRWAWASGSAHAQWGIGGVPILDEAGQMIDQGTVLFRMDEVTIEDTWFMTGMKGTASNTVVAEEMFVPDHRYFSVLPAIGGVYPTEHTEEALYRSALVPVLALILVGPMLGLASAALDKVVADSATKGIAYTGYAAQRDSVTFQYQVAEAASKIDTAYLHAFRAADDIDRAARAGTYPDFATRARVRQDTGYASRHCREALDLLMTAHGASSFAEASVMQRIWRDLNTAGRHAVVLPTVSQEIYGRALLGVEEFATPLV